jgi:FlaA1/EpsC-like NDP-sugar epimerase
MPDLSKLPRKIKAAMIFAADGLLLPLALWMAFGFRLGPIDPSRPFGLIDPLAWVDLVDLAVIWFGSLAILAGFRLYLIKLHAIDLDAVKRIALASLAIGAFTAVLSFFLQSGFPRSIPVLYGASFFVLAVCMRIAALRLLSSLANIGKDRVPVAIYGAGAAGIQLAASLKQSRELQPVMFVDDNPSLHNVIVGGIRVKPRQSLQKAARQRRIEQVLIAIPSLSSARAQRLAREMSDLGLQVKVIPSYVDLVSGRDVVDSLRPVDPDDLLGRDKVDLDIPEVASAYAGRSVMITGAGGSIGGELCQQLLACDPASVVLFERSEPALYEIDRQLRPEAEARGVALHCVLGSVTNRACVDSALSRFGVDVLLHAAAYKHVPLVEANEVEGARNNVLGTHTVVEAAIAAELERFILVSTDKAVRPTNVMGATKRLAELLVHDAQRRSTRTRFSFVRFGNVLGSSGSVVPLFSKQIAAGGPVTVTHPDVTRFFMTITEAARLVLLAGAYAKGDDLYVLDMGEPVKIMALAERMIRLAGRTVHNDENPDGDVAIECVGLRPGEKLYEEVLIDDASLVQTPHPKILRSRTAGVSAETIEMMLAQVHDAVGRRESSAVRALATAYVEGFNPSDPSKTVLPFPAKRAIS